MSRILRFRTALARALKALLGNLKGKSEAVKSSSRQGLLELVRMDKKYMCLTPEQWLHILVEVQRYMSDSMLQAETKGKEVDIRLAEFFRVVCRHAFGMFRAEDPNGRSHGPKLKNEYLEIMCDLLEAKTAQYLQPAERSKLFLYAMKWFPDCERPDYNSWKVHIRFLKMLFKALFRDILVDSSGPSEESHAPEVTLEHLLRWLEAKFFADPSQDLSSTLVGTVADCLGQLIDLQGLRCMPVFCGHARLTSLCLIRKFPLLPPTPREAVLRFFMRFLRMYRACEAVLLVANSNDEADRQDTALATMRQILCKIEQAVLSEDFCRAVANLGRQQKANLPHGSTNEDLFWCSWSDPKVRLHLEVAAQAVIVCQRAGSSEVLESIGSLESQISLEDSLDDSPSQGYDSKRRRLAPKSADRSLSSSSSSNDNKCGRIAAVRQSSTYFDAINLRDLLRNMTDSPMIVADPTPIRPTMSTQGTTKRPFMASALSHLLLIEGRCMVLRAVCKFSPSGYVFAQDRDNRLLTLADNVMSLASLFTTTREKDTQVCGQVLVTLLELTRVSVALLTAPSSDYGAEVDRSVAIRLSEAWLVVVEAVFTSSDSLLFNGYCSNGTLADIGTELLAALLRSNLVPEGTEWKIQQLILSSALLTDPAVAAGGYRVLHLVAVMCGVQSAGAASGTFDGLLHTLLTQNVRDMPCLASTTATSLHAMKYLTCWISEQYLNTGEVRVHANSSDRLKPCIDAIDSIFTEVYGTKSTVNDITDSVSDFADDPFRVLESPFAHKDWFQDAHPCSLGHIVDGRSESLCKDKNRPVTSGNGHTATYFEDTFKLLERLKVNLSLTLGSENYNDDDNTCHRLSAWEVSTCCTCRALLSLASGLHLCEPDQGSRQEQVMNNALDCFCDLTESLLGVLITHANVLSMRRLQECLGILGEFVNEFRVLSERSHSHLHSPRGQSCSALSRRFMNLAMTIRRRSLGLVGETLSTSAMIDEAIGSRVRQESTNDFLDSDDDEFVAVEPLNGKGKNALSSLDFTMCALRLTFEPDEEECFVKALTAARTLSLLTEPEDQSGDMNYNHAALPSLQSILTSSGDPLDKDTNDPVCMNDESFLSTLLRLAPVWDPFDLYACMMGPDTTWHGVLGYIGEAKYLEVVTAMLVDQSTSSMLCASDNFTYERWSCQGSADRRVALLKQLSAMVHGGIPKSISFNECEVVRLRTNVVVCSIAIAGALVHTNVSDITDRDDLADLRNIVGGVFPNKCLDQFFTQQETRVLLESIKAIPILFKGLTATKATALYNRIQVVDEYALTPSTETCFEDHICFVSQLSAWTTVAVTHPSMTSQVLLDILMYCTRYEQLARSLSKWAALDMHTIMKQLLTHLARQQGYANVVSMLREHERVLVAGWLQTGTDGDEEKTFTFSVSDFPFFLFEEESQAAYFRKSQDLWVSEAALLYDQRDTHGTKRWQQLTAVVERLSRRNTATDKDVYNWLERCIIVIKIQAMSAIDPVDIARSNSLEDFLTRQRLPEKTIKEKMTKYTSDALSAVLDNIIYGSRNATSHITSPADMLEAVSAYIGTDSLTQFFSRCNALNMLVQINSALHKVRSSEKLGCIVRALFIVVKTVPFESAVLIRGLCHTCVLTLQRCPIHVGYVMRVLVAFISRVRNLTGTLYDDVAADVASVMLFVQHALQQFAHGQHTPSSLRVFDVSLLQEAYSNGLIDIETEVWSECTKLAEHTELILSTKMTSGKKVIQGLWPLPVELVEGLTLLPQTFEEDKFPIPPVTHVVRGFLDTAARFLEGRSCLFCPVLLQMKRVRRVLTLTSAQAVLSSSSPSAKKALAWKDDAELTARCFSALLCIHRASVELHIDVTDDVVSVLCQLGPPDLHDVDHSLLPMRDTSLKTLTQDFTRQGVLARISSLLLKEDGGASGIAETAIAALRGLACCGVLNTFLPPSTKTEPLRTLAHAFSLPLEKPPLSLAESAALVSGAKTLGAIAAIMMRSEAQGCWSEHVWGVSGRPYSVWVTRVASALIARYIFIMGTHENSSDFESDVLFFKALHPICVKDVPTAEMVLPLLVNELRLRDSECHARLASCLREYVLGVGLTFDEGTDSSATEHVRRAMRTSLRMLVFLLQNDIRQFAETPPSPIPDPRPTREVSSRMASPRPFPHSFSAPLGLDFLYLSKASLRCQCVASALWFLELHLDPSRRAAMDEMSTLQQDDSDGEWILLQIFRMVHDPDALFSVDSGRDLEMQALVYAETEQWGEALATYESLVHIGSSYDSARRDRAKDGIPTLPPRAGIANALRGQGLFDVLNKYSAAADRHIGDGGWAGLGLGLSATHGGAMKGNAAPNADASLRQWSIPTQRMAIQDHRRTLHETTLQAVLRDLDQGDLASALSSIKLGEERAYKTLVMSSARESGKELIVDLGAMQKLFESKEAALLLQGSLSTHPPQAAGNIESARALLRTWASRRSETSTENGDTLSHRLGLLQILSRAGCVPACIGEMLLSQAGKVIRGKGPRVAHALSGLFYRIRGFVLSEQSEGGDERGRRLQMQGRAPVGSLAYWHLEEAKLQWEKGLQATATSTLRVRVLDALEAAADADKSSTVRSDPRDDRHRLNVKCDALVTAGQWNHVRRALSSQTILERYLQPAAEIQADMEQQMRAFRALGFFHAEVYAHLDARLTSTEWREAGSRMEEEERTLAQGDRSIPQVRDRLKELRNQKAERRGVEAGLAQHMVGALDGFRQVLTRSTENDMDVVFALISMWFKNAESSEANAILLKIALSTESYKFIPLGYQIVSRLGAPDQTPDFSHALSQLVERMLRGHPHHTLHLVLTAAERIHLTGPSFKRADQEKRGRSSGSKTGGSPTKDGSRAHEAARVLDRLCQSDKAFDDLVTMTAQTLCAYHSLAMLSVGQNPPQDVYRGLSFKALSTRFDKNYPSGNSPHFYSRMSSVLRSRGGHPAMLTVSHTLRADGVYDDIVRIHSIEDRCVVSQSGLSKPKIITVLGTDGVQRRELVKGKDDVRQDAVMEQLFEHVNVMLARCPATQQRRLHIRTYRIVPLTPQSGVIEFVSDTMAFADFVNDAHVRYRPGDWSSRECRKRIKEVQQQDQGDAGLCFEQICEHFKPVFRYFFLEHYPDPSHWLSRRLNYIRSVAATSMVGHIMGIGDRHASNILVDTSTAELIHIDFGITFDQGKILTTPETVPFRLTRDIVDGMGSCGVEGTFRRCAEEVLRVLRDNTTALRTIVEVVIYDPLYKWVVPLPGTTGRSSRDKLTSRAAAAAPAKAMVGVGDKAQLTLSRVVNKLQGIDQRTGDTLSVEGCVQMLLQEATDSGNLGRLFHGWSAWL